MNADEWDDWCRRRAQAVRSSAPAAFRSASLEFVPAEGKLADWCRSVLDGRATPLLLDGPVGTGKTYSAYACWFSLVAQGWTGSWRSTTEAAYLDALRPGGDRQFAVMCDSADVLHLDDIAATPASDWTRGVMFALIDQRWSAQQPTVVTTNLTGKALQEHLGERAASRLAHGVTTVTLTGQDRRR